MKSCTRILAAVLGLTGIAAAQTARDPETNLVVPSIGQLAWHHDEMAVFFHMNPTFPVGTMTFANFNPVALLDAAESVGAKHIVLVAKHVDGFCWWPTQAAKPGEAQNTKNIALTQFKGGGGNVVREIFDEARKRGLRVGVYLATTDEHFGAGGGGSFPANQQAYNDYYIAQATELATQYGDLAEWWLDGGAIPSLGAAINALLAAHQPQAVVFQGTNATLRWVGNESGTAPYPSWNTISQTDWNSVTTNGWVVTNGNPDGVHWTPAEVDTPLSTGWFDGGPRSLADLTNVFYQSIGHGAGLLLNFPVQTDGTISAANRARGVELGQAIDSAVGHPLFSTADRTGSEVILDCGAATEIDHVIVQEDLRFGERVRAFTIDAWDGSQWRAMVTGGTAIGEKQIRKFTPTSYAKVRLTVTSAVGTPRIRSLAVTRTGVRAPDLTPPTVPTGLAATVAENRVTLTWQAAADPDTGIAHYRVYRDDGLLGTTTQTDLVDTHAPENMTVSYQVSAVNGFGLESARCTAISAGTGTDLTAPTVLAATTLPGRTRATVVFSEPLASAQAEMPAHYRMSHGRTVAAATFNPATADRVTLTFDQALSPDILYTLRVDGLKDTAAVPNVIPPDSKISFRINAFGMVRYWKCDDRSGTTAKDAVAGDAAPGNNGVVSGATWTAGKLGGALNFDGNDHVDVGGAGLQANFTLALWVRPQSSASFQVLAAKDRSGVGAYQQRLYLLNQKPGFTLSDQDGNDLGLWPFEGTTALALNTWTHLAVTSQNGVFKLYVNGIVALTKDLGGMVQSPYNPVNMLLGARWNSAATAKLDYFTGQLDDIRLHTEALAAEEIQRVVAAATTPAPPADTDGDEISDTWELHHAGNLAMMSAASDADHDGALDRHEYLADTDPRDPLDRFRITRLQRDSAHPTAWQLTWTSKPTRVYRTEQSAGLDPSHWIDSGLGLIQPAAGIATTVTVPLAGERAFLRVCTAVP
jgi:alpha-L-fucosidase